MLGVYFETWACPWSADGKTNALAKIESPYNLVFISFVHPSCKYELGKKSFEGTGLNFSSSFKTIVDAIKIIKQKGIRVMLAVGGATYSFDNYNAKAVLNLATDMEVDGVDIDWEPAEGIKDDHLLGPIIAQTRACAPNLLISMAGFALGAEEPTGSKYVGVNRKGLISHGHLLDFVNIMNYDGGKQLDTLFAYESYRQIFSKRLLYGFQVGKQGWGDALLTRAEVERACNEIVKNKDGCFVWAYFKSGNPNAKEVIKIAADILKHELYGNQVKCPKCETILSLCVSK